MSAATFSITGTTPAAPGTAVVGSAITWLDRYDVVRIAADLVGATGGPLDVYLQTSPNGGANWYDFAHFPQLAAAAAATKYFVAPTGSNAITVVGKDLAPALAANTCVGGHPGERMRVVAVAGALTTAGAAVTISVECIQLDRTAR